MPAKEPLFNRLRNYGVSNVLKRNLIAEFTATFFLVFIGTCIVSQFHLGKGTTTNWLGVNLGWGIAIWLCVVMTARTSGGHMNPAVSLLMWTMGHIPFTWVLLYSIAQTLGAFLASACMYYYYIDLFNAYDKGVRALLGPTGSGVCFCSYPNPALQGFFMPYIDQIVCTGILCYFLCAIIDERNQIPKVWHPFLFFGLLTMIGAGFGALMGYPMNPARDFGPRLFSVFIYGSDPFTVPYSSYFLAPIIGPLIGAVFGGWLYQATIGMHIPPLDETQPHSAEELKLLPKV